MKRINFIGSTGFVIVFLVITFFSQNAFSQENRPSIFTYEDYADSFLEEHEEYIATIEEWQSVISQWLEKPLNINGEEAEWLMEYKIISLYQLNKLKEYRLIYGDLLSLYELAFIDSWDYQTVRKVIPLAAIKTGQPARTFRAFSMRSFQHQLLLKSAVNTFKSKGYLAKRNSDDSLPVREYTGSPVKILIRYNVDYRNRFSAGINMEKDPGEPWLVSSSSIRNFKEPELLTGYLHIKKTGPFKDIILGNYRISFGYGINMGNGQTGIRGRNGLAGMADRIRPQTSAGESGFYRGIAFSAARGSFSLTGFASYSQISGTSVVTDSLTGKPVSFSSEDRSGLHRTVEELLFRKSIREKVFGGFIVYRNNWLKTGLIAVYNGFNVPVASDVRPYAQFGFKGKENLVMGISATAWMPGIQISGEASVSRNKALAMISGLQVTPVPGILAIVSYRKFPIYYQNRFGAGYISSGNNTDEEGIFISFRVELPRKWLAELSADHSRSSWISYDLDAPSEKSEVKLALEKAITNTQLVILSFKYLNTLGSGMNDLFIIHPLKVNHYNLRLEGRVETEPGIRLKSRIEWNFSGDGRPGWLLFQDIEANFPGCRMKSWLRLCFFDVPAYESRLYAYENDVLYDYTSFMYYGKGIRSIILFRFEPLHWMNLWLRFSMIYYTNKFIGTGWDETGKNRQHELEIQLRIKVPG
jgi:hypothetical protein